MTKQECFDALNITAMRLGLNKGWIDVDREVFVPQSLKDISALIFQLDYPPDKNTDLIKEQSLNLIRKGRLIFD